MATRETICVFSRLYCACIRVANHQLYITIYWCVLLDFCWRLVFNVNWPWEGNHENKWPLSATNKNTDWHSPYVVRINFAWAPITLCIYNILFTDVLHLHRFSWHQPYIKTCMLFSTSVVPSSMWLCFYFFYSPTSNNKLMADLLFEGLWFCVSYMSLTSTSPCAISPRCAIPRPQATVFIDICSSQSGHLLGSKK